MTHAKQKIACEVWNSNAVSANNPPYKGRGNPDIGTAGCMEQSLSLLLLVEQNPMWIPCSLDYCCFPLIHDAAAGGGGGGVSSYQLKTLYLLGTCCYRMPVAHPKLAQVLSCR
mmetsp:Transcript_37240/g.62614  ORF Transcript_37240/g.62614 Transcript_37240/m.62614 type:complete len:113 (+) Transcript_37240:348-686(+)